MSLHLRIEAKSFRSTAGEARPVLGRIDLVLQQREIVALVGPSGCGKTTLLRIAGGLDTAFQGTCRWSDDVAPRIGTVFQEPRLLAWRTVRENVLLAQTVANTGMADELLHTLDLTPVRDVFPGTLSLGMARRVAIARALAIEPNLLLLDEPFVSLDPAMSRQVRALLLAAWRARPIAALLVTHDRAEAAGLADRVLVLGGTPAEIVEEIIVTKSTRRPLDTVGPGNKVME